MTLGRDSARSEIASKTVKAKDGKHFIPEYDRTSFRKKNINSGISFCSNSPYSPPMQRALPVIVFAIVLISARIIGALNPESFGNLQPFGALFFCGMALFGSRGLILAAATWLISYPITSTLQGYSVGLEILVPIVGFAAMVGLARFFRKSSSLRMFTGSLLGAIAFYLITNSLSWAFDPLYAPKSLATFGQALWTGLPGYSPTWLFFRNALIAQAVFSGIFIVATQGISITSSRKREQAFS